MFLLDMELTGSKPKAQPSIFLSSCYTSPCNILFHF